MNTKEKSIALELSHKLIKFFDEGTWYFTDLPSRLTEAQIDFIFDQLYEADCERVDKWRESKQTKHDLVQDSYHGPIIRPNFLGDSAPRESEKQIEPRVVTAPLVCAIEAAVAQLKKTGVTQRAIAKELGVSEVTFSNWKNKHKPIPITAVRKLWDMRDRVCK